MKSVSTEEAAIELQAESVRRWDAARREQPDMQDARERVAAFLRALCNIPSRARDVVIWRHCGWTWQAIGDGMGGKSRVAAMRFHASIMRANPDIARFFQATTNNGGDHEAVGND